MPSITRRILSLAVVLSASLAAQQTAPPKTMTKMEVIRQSADAPEGSFAAKPRVIYRAGTQFGRIEEAPDPERGIHGVAIIAEPEFWLVNLANKTAKHAVDPGPTFDCTMPIFTNIPGITEDQKQQVMALEFGREMEFFKSHGATPRPGGVLQTKETTAYKVSFGDVSLGLFTYGTPEIPLGVVWTKGDAHAILWYSGYGEMPFDLKLFSKPENVKIVDAKPQ